MVRFFPCTEHCIESAIAALEIEVKIEPGQVLRAESGAMLYMTNGIKMETTLGADGIGAGLKRYLTGQNLFLADYSYEGEEGTYGTVGLGTDFPSKIVRLSLDEYGGKIVCQKSAYLAGSDTVNIEMEFAKKFTAGFFGGEGFILQSLTGKGDVFVKAGGTLIRKDLEEGESLRVASGSLVAMTQDVNFDVTQMPGFKNVVFGGEGLFVTTLTGPGTVWLQGQPPDRMISEIARRVPSGGGIGLGVPLPIGMGGGGASAGADGAGAAAAGAASGAVPGGDGSAAGFQAAAATDAAASPDVASSSSSSNMSSENFGESTTMTGNDQQFNDFTDDTTTFSTSDEMSFGDGSTDIGGESANVVGDATEAAGGVLDTVWGFFNDN